MYEVALTLGLVVFIALAIWYGRSGYFSVFHPFTIYMIFHGFLFVFRPIIAWAMGFDFIYILYGFLPSESDKINAILVSIVGVLSFAFFCFRHGNAVMQFRWDRFTTLERQSLLRPFILMCVICLPIATYSLIRSWGEANDGTMLAAMVRDKASRVMINTGQNGYLTDAQFMLVTIAPILAWLLRFRLIAVLPLAGFIVLRASTGGRGGFVAAAAGFVLLWLYDQRRKWPTLGALLGSALLIMVFNAVGADRGLAIRQWLGTDNTVQYRDNGVPLRPLEGMDFANLEYLEYVVYTIPQRTHSYSYFTDQLQLLTEPIPRVLWPGKPVGAPIQLFNLFDYGNPIGMTVSLAGMGWVGAGWLGVVLWCGLWGYVLGLIYRKYSQGAQSAFQTAAYMALLSSLIVAFRDGGLVTLARQNIFFMVPIVMWLFFARQMGIRSAARVPESLAAQSASRSARADLPQSAPVEAAEPVTHPLGFAAARATLQPPPAVIRRRKFLIAARLELENGQGS